MSPIAVTNNDLIAQTMSDKHFFSQIIYDRCSFADTLETAMGMIKKGHILLAEPLTGNVPPCEMPFKTVLLSESTKVIDFNSLNSINAAIRITEASLKGTKKTVWGKNDLEGFKKNDLVVVQRWMMRVHFLKLLKDGVSFDEQY